MARGWELEHAKPLVPALARVMQPVMVERSEMLVLARAMQPVMVERSEMLLLVPAPGR